MNKINLTHDLENRQNKQSQPKFEKRKNFKERKN